MSCAGTGTTGVVATDDIDALLALQPDCVVYNPKWPNVDELVRILESGINVVTTAAFITGHALGDDRQRVIDACERGQASIFGSGMNPGLANLLGIVSASVCDRVDSITITRVGRLDRLRLARDRAADRVRPADRRSRPRRR